MREVLHGNSNEMIPELDLFLELERMNWQHLPYAGGLWNQPYWLMKRLQICREEIGKFNQQQSRKKEMMAKLREHGKKKG